MMGRALVKGINDAASSAQRAAATSRADGPSGAYAAIDAPRRSTSGSYDDSLLGDADILLGPDVFPERPEDDEVVTGAVYGESPCKSVYEVLIAQGLFTFKDLLRVRFCQPQPLSYPWLHAIAAWTRH